jgi:8-oxo-dGTP diphosphatase
MTITKERYDAALAGAEPVTYHTARCPAATSLGELPCDFQRCGAEVHHRQKLDALKVGLVSAAFAPVLDSMRHLLKEPGVIIQSPSRPLPGQGRAYVVGFAYCGDLVVLIKKQRPEWQRGRLNGVGGKVEPGENPHAAMVREFREETGLDVPEWTKKATFTGTEPEGGAPYIVHVFSAFVGYGRITNVATVTDEAVLLYNARKLPGIVMPNLRWMVPLALDPGVDLATIVEVPGAAARK